MPKTNQTDKKVMAIFKLIEYFLDGKEITKNDPILLEEFQCSTKTLERYLKDLERRYKNIVTIKQSRKNYYKLIKASDIIMEFLKYDESDIGVIFDWLKNESIFLKEMEEETKEALRKISSTDKSIFIFKSYPFEDFKNRRLKEIFDELKIAVKNNEYRDIEFFYDKNIYYKNAKCLKLVFVDHNWYIAIEDERDDFHFLRVSFIKNIIKYKNFSYQKSVNEKYFRFFETFQNSMTLYGVQSITAKLEASKKIAKYFDKDMKKFFPSQKFIKKNIDGSVEFSINYTQPMEILPFIKKWLPDIRIISPLSLKDKFRKDLKKALL